jgi:hypothetical protein
MAKSDMSKAKDEMRSRKARALRDAERALKAAEDAIATKGEHPMLVLQLKGARRRLGARRSALSRYDNSKRGS